MDEYGSYAIMPDNKASSTTTAFAWPSCSDIRQSPQDLVMSKLEFGAKSGILSKAVEPSTAHKVRPEVCSTEVMPELVSTNMRVSVIIYGCENAISFSRSGVIVIVRMTITTVP